jgi:hypothetical protein
MDRQKGLASFVGAVLDAGQAWMAWTNDGGTIAGTDCGIFVWSSRSAANRAAKALEESEYSSYKVDAIDVYIFMVDLLPKLEEDGFACILPGIGGDTGTEISALELKEMLDAEILRRPAPYSWPQQPEPRSAVQNR